MPTSQLISWGPLIQNLNIVDEARVLINTIDEQRDRWGMQVIQVQLHPDTKEGVLCVSNIVQLRYTGGRGDKPVIRC
jgi:hypothetical protein